MKDYVTRLFFYYISYNTDINLNVHQRRIVKLVYPSYKIPHIDFITE